LAWLLGLAQLALGADKAHGAFVLSTDLHLPLGQELTVVSTASLPKYVVIHARCCTSSFRKRCRMLCVMLPPDVLALASLLLAAAADY
jgi:hypothetical protein